MRKIHGRPLLPWWIYVGYFLLGLISVFSNAFGTEMPTQTVKINEDSLARAIVKAMREFEKEDEKEDLAEEGRYGDTELAHVNEEEKAMLQAHGGAGTRNPKTGLREYYEASPGGTDRFGGTEGQDFGNYSEAEARETGFYGPEYNPNDPAFNPNSSPAGSTSSGGLAGLINNVITSPKPSVLSPTSRLAYEAARGLGNYVGEPLDRAFGGRGIAEEPQFTGSAMGPEGRNDQLMQQLAVEPGVTQAPAYMRPAPVEPPTNLGLQGLSDIQKRTMMATYGSQGAQSQYRTPEAMRAYGNLIARALIGDNNQVAGNEPGTLPIEDQYLRQVFGIQKPNTAQALLDALKPYWSQ